MSNVTSKPEQSTTTEAQLLTALFNLAATPTAYAIVKNGDGTFSNVSVASDLPANTTLLGNVTTGTGSTIVLANSPVFVNPDIGDAVALSVKPDTASSGFSIKNANGVNVATFGVGSAASTNISFGGTLSMGANSITMTGSLGATGARLTAGWFTDLTVTNAIAGSVTGSAGSVAVGGITGLGTGVATALAVNVGTAGSFVVNGGALGTPSSGTLTNATGLPVAGITASTVTALGVGSIELGHATDTTIARVSAGVVSIEGVNILTTGTGLALAGGTMTGKFTEAGRDVVGATYSPASGAQTVALDCTTNNVHIVNGNVNGTAITFTITGATNNQPFIVSILQGGTTVSTISGWFATVRWAGGTPPTLTATLNKRDTFGFIRTGTNTYDGFIVGQNA